MLWLYDRDSVYWGHNALIRVAPFRQHCRLPTLPGKPPLGGTGQLPADAPGPPGPGLLAALHPARSP
jgi:hypothetical protein